MNCQDNKDPIRLQLFLARCGVASRRASEKLITDGRVTVNGTKVTELGTKVFGTEEICVDNKKVVLEDIKRYVLLYKPSGYVCSSSDEKQRQTATDLLKTDFSERLYSVGRLDMYSTGLIIYTNDGEFAAKISHPSAQIEKEYVVDTSLPIPRDLVEKFRKGIRIDDVFYKCSEAEEINSHRIRVVLIEGKNREIRRVFEKFEIGIKSLTRIRIGNIQINGLFEGHYRELSQEEINGLLSLAMK